MSQNTIDTHLRQVVARHTPNVTYIVEYKVNELRPHIHAWANGHEYIIKLSGSLAKGTAITGTTDIDLFISLHPSVSTCNTLENVYNTLRNRFTMAGYVAREQNVSIGIDHTKLKIDVVAGVKHNASGLDHSIWKRKKQTWTKTNIDEHINYIKKSGRVFDIKMIKIWRKLKKLDFPSFYLELSVIEALKGTLLLGSSPSENFVKIMNYFKNDFVNKIILDPTNENNKVSEELTQIEKREIRNVAISTLQGQWDQAIW
jgi:hypothetical protein